MIDYNVGFWGFRGIFKIKGSVFPRSFCPGISDAILGMFLHYCLHPEVPNDRLTMRPPPEPIRILPQMVDVNVIWSGYTVVLGFLIVFRNNQAYARFWEGATLINQVRGEWFNAVSSLIAFCSREEHKKAEVANFQQVLVRLASLMYCSALQQVCELADDTLEILDTKGVSEESLEFLQAANDRCEVVLQWVQRLIIEAHRDDVVDVSAPILSRAFQELSRGIVNLNNVRKIREIPFPFPYTQMITFMLLVHFVVTPFLASQVIEAWWWCGLACFFVTTAFWSMFYIAAEIDQPFGEDDNDLPVTEMQEDFNRSLLTLLEPLAQTPPCAPLEEINSETLNAGLRSPRQLAQRRPTRMRSDIILHHTGSDRSTNRTRGTWSLWSSPAPTPSSSWGMKDVGSRRDKDSQHRPRNSTSTESTGEPQMTSLQPSEGTDSEPLSGREPGLSGARSKSQGRWTNSKGNRAPQTAHWATQASGTDSVNTGSSGPDYHSQAADWGTSSMSTAGAPASSCRNSHRSLLGIGPGNDGSVEHNDSEERAQRSPANATSGRPSSLAARVPRGTGNRPSGFGDGTASTDSLRLDGLRMPAGTEMARSRSGSPSSPSQSPSPTAMMSPTAMSIGSASSVMV